MNDDDTKKPKPPEYKLELPPEQQLAYLVQIAAGLAASGHFTRHGKSIAIAEAASNILYDLFRTVEYSRY
jgi:hypothetical protein